MVRPQPPETSAVAKTCEITMSMRELDRLKTVQAVVDGHLKPGQAAQRLGITARQMRRLVRRFRDEGPAGLASRRRGRPSNHQLPPGLAEQALELIRDRYPDFGPTLAREKLAQCHGLSLAKETVRRLMTEAGYWVPRRQRPPEIHQPRHRRACLGELVQIDGSEHGWFESRGPQCTLLVFVDDATSRLMALRFVESESTFAYFVAAREYLERHGKPVAFYSDKASVFRVNHKDAQGGDGFTQFGRALYELNIDSLCANSSQAKGRVERAHKPLQDRLVKELRLRGIATMEAANAFLPSFIADYNARFAKPPKSGHDRHRPLRPDEDLDLIFAWREPRRVSKSLTLQYDKVLYLMEDSPGNRALVGQYVMVYHYPDGRIEPRANGAPLPCIPYDRLSEVDQGAIVENKRLGHVLQVAQIVQAQRDNRRSQSLPRTGKEPRRRRQEPGKKAQRTLGGSDVAEALGQWQRQKAAQDST
jgi:transposase